MTPIQNDHIAKDLKLKEILASIPREYMKKDLKRAWLNFLLSFSLALFGVLLMIFLPWFLIWIGWIVTGLGMASLFAIFHECGHGSFADKKTNNILGHVISSLLLYPYTPWVISHNKHHAYTDHLEKDTAWRPTSPEVYQNSSLTKKIYIRISRSVLFPIESIRYMLSNSLNFKDYKPREKKEVIISNLVVLFSAVVIFGTIIYFAGPIGFVIYWLIPWFVFHFLAAMVTLLHHTSPEVKFYTADEWSKEKSNILSTVHMKYPGWLEFILHDFNVHVPHHVSTAIPSYNLKKAHKSLKSKYGDYIHEYNLSPKYLLKVLDECKLYDRGEDKFVKFM
jgi:acyl-lipid omega-6 desaturase (Delta-12 desaturase)